MHESSSQDVVVKTLLKKSKEVLDVWEKEVKDKIKSKEDIYYEVLSKIGNMPHLFVLGCIMDRQIPAERAWAIPEKVFKYFNCDTIPELAKISEQDYINCFVKEKLHRFNEIEGQCFYEAVQRIHDQYKDNAANIWQNNASAADVIERFKEFKGCGDKIATMATNILQRDLGVKFSDYSAIDVSPDVHVCRVLYKLRALTIQNLQWKPPAKSILHFRALLTSLVGNGVVRFAILPSQIARIVLLTLSARKTA